VCTLLPFSRGGGGDANLSHSGRKAFSFLLSLGQVKKLLKVSISNPLFGGEKESLAGGGGLREGAESRNRTIFSGGRGQRPSI